MLVLYSLSKLYNIFIIFRIYFCFRATDFKSLMRLFSRSFGLQNSILPIFFRINLLKKASVLKFSVNVYRFYLNYLVVFQFLKLLLSLTGVYNVPTPGAGGKKLFKGFYIWKINFKWREYFDGEKIIRRQNEETRS